MKGLTERRMEESGRAPLVIEPVTHDRDLPRLLEGRRPDIEARLAEFGALLFRGFAIGGVQEFEAFITAVSPQRLNYVYRSTPRTAVGDRIFTATEYPAAESIPLHNENSYQREWPMKIALCCLAPARRGGETPIADMRRVTAALDGKLLDRLEERKVRYVRHYRPYIDLSWQDVFQTSDRNAVARFCEHHDIGFEWLDDETLRTTQISQGVARHPYTGERVLFNQAHLFHVSSLIEEDSRALVELFGADRLPRQAYYGGGEHIAPADIAAIRGAFESCAFVFQWQAGDILLLDNMQFAHGRRPYEGPRKVVVSLLEPYAPAGGATIPAA